MHLNFQHYVQTRLSNGIKFDDQSKYKNDEINNNMNATREQAIELFEQLCPETKHDALNLLLILKENQNNFNNYFEKFCAERTINEKNELPEKKDIFKPHFWNIIIESTRKYKGIIYPIDYDDFFKKVEVKKSEIENAGDGLFAKEFIEKGSYILPYDGVYMSNNTLEKIYGDNLAPFTLQVSDDIYIDGKGFLAAKANDYRGSKRSSPNAELASADDNLVAWIEAVEDINPGEEILIDYGEDYWKGYEIESKEELNSDISESSENEEEEELNNNDKMKDSNNDLDGTSDIDVNEGDKKENNNFSNPFLNKNVFINMCKKLFTNDTSVGNTTILKQIWLDEKFAVECSYLWNDLEVQETYQKFANEKMNYESVKNFTRFLQQKWKTLGNFPKLNPLSRNSQSKIWRYYLDIIEMNAPVDIRPIIQKMRNQEIIEKGELTEEQEKEIKEFLKQKIPNRIEIIRTWINHPNIKETFQLKDIISEFKDGEIPSLDNKIIWFQ